MKINTINKQSTFGSKVRLQSDLVYYISSNKNREYSLLKKVKQLEKNGNDDLVILSLKTEDYNDFNTKDYIRMEVFEKRSDGYYTSEDPIDAVLTEYDEKRVVNKPYYLMNMYKQAKENVTKLVKRMDKFIPYL